MLYTIPTGQGAGMVLANMVKTPEMIANERQEKLDAHEPHQGSKEMQRRHKQMAKLAAKAKQEVKD